MSEASRLRALTEAGLLHANPGGGARAVVHRGRRVLPGRGQGPGEVRDAARHLVDGRPVTDAAAAHGYSRAAFYLVLASFSQAGMSGLLDERRGRRGPVKLRPGDRGVHPRRRGGPGPAGRAGRRPVRGAAAPAHHRAGPGPVSTRSFWPPAEAAQADYETLRAHLLEPRRAAR